VAKQRNGPTGLVHLNFISRYTCFDNPETAHHVE
jgi:replicative DNA helicase